MPDSGFGALVVLAGGLIFQTVFGVLVLIRPRRSQNSSLAWILIIVTLPGVGIVLYLLFGEMRIGKRRRRRHAQIRERVRPALVRAWARIPEGSVPEGVKPVAYLTENVGAPLPRGGNRLELLAHGDHVVEALVADIEAATHHVHLLYYIYLDDRSGRLVADALVAAAARGIECRLLVDAVGSTALLKSELVEVMKQGGVQVVSALPTRITQVASVRFDMRNHRKMAIVDGRIGYTGSHNLAEEDFTPKPRYAPWIDATVRIEGPAVRDLQSLFVEDWYMDTTEGLDHLLHMDTGVFAPGSTVQIIGTGVNSPNEALVGVIQGAIHQADEELILTTPYFVPDEGTLAALTTAALRGVETTLVLPARNDSRLVALASRSFFPALVGSGVRIMEYQDGLLHSKTMTVDRKFSLVSTANFDRRSFEINFEVTTLVYDTDFASRLRLLQRTYIERCHPLSESEWVKRPWPKRLAENLAGLVSPLL